MASCCLVRTADDPIVLSLTFNSLDTPLATGFDILEGHQAVTVPVNIKPGTEYAIVRKLNILVSGIALF